MVLKSLFFFARECSEFQFFFFFSLKCFLIPDWLLGVLNILFFSDSLPLFAIFFANTREATPVTVVCVYMSFMGCTIFGR